MGFITEQKSKFPGSIGSIARAQSPPNRPSVYKLYSYQFKYDSKQSRTAVFWLRRLYLDLYCEFCLYLGILTHCINASIAHLQFPSHF
jgi:hypothetical protein